MLHPPFSRRPVNGHTPSRDNLPSIVATMDNHTEQSLRLLDKIKQSLATPESTSAEHVQVLADISRLQLAVETPLETIYRIGHQTWQNACAGVSVDVQELASARDADVVFLVRIMRVIVALGLCTESGANGYKANSKTQIMTIPQGIASFKSWFDIFTPTAAKLPEYMRSQHYQNPTQSTDSAFAYANGSEFWKHLTDTPEHSHIFNDFMATRRQGRPSWYDIYPVNRELLLSCSNANKNPQPEADVLIVDVGGNRGHDLVKLRAKYPGLVGKMILQDLPEVIAHASFEPDDGKVIEAMVHDFFQPQPVRRIYSLS
ncbi:MAG: hypothetical protein Q9218_003470 [Villophora microphyllina]